MKINFVSMPRGGSYFCRVLGLLALALLCGVSGSFARQPKAAGKPAVKWKDHAFNLPNSCLLDAVAASEAVRAGAILNKSNVWHRVLIVEYWNEKKVFSSHAYLVYRYPAGSDVLWAYDKVGSRRILNDGKDPMSVARTLQQYPVQAFYAEDLPALLAGGL